MPSGAARSAPWAHAARTALALFASWRSRAARVVRTTSVFRGMVPFASISKRPH